MACVWQGVQSYLGGECVTLCLRAIWPSYVTRPSLTQMYMGNTVSGYGVLSFALFNIFAFGFLLPEPQQIRWLFRVKALVTPVAMFGLMIWVLVDAHGGGRALSAPATVHGSRLGWLWISGCMSCISNMATLSVNMPDFARMATSVHATRWSQLLSMPITFAITSLIGVIIASASAEIYGKQFWNPLDVMGAKLDANPHKGTARTGVFFIAAMFVLIQIGTNIAANSLSAGSDFTALLSRYINIRRGSIICWVVGFAYCPWVIMSSSSHFQTALSAFAVFLASIAGVMVAHYFVVDRGYINVPALYRITLPVADVDAGAGASAEAAGSGTGARSPYMYGRTGCNWRAYMAYFVGLGVNMPGFVQVVGSFGATPLIDSPGLADFYSMAYIWGFLISALVYCALNAAWPSTYAVPLTPLTARRHHTVWREPPSLSWEMPDWTTPVWALDASAVAAASAALDAAQRTHPCPADIEADPHDSSVAHIDADKDTDTHSLEEKDSGGKDDDPYAAKPTVSATSYLGHL